MKNLSWCFLIILCVVFVSHARSEAIYNFKFSPPSPALLQLDQDLNIMFDYISTEPGGIRVFVLPYTDGSPTNGYIVPPSPVYPIGSGHASAWIRFTKDSVVVDQILFQVTTADQSRVIMEFFIPVDYHFSYNSIFNIVMTPASPAPLQFYNDIQLTYNYTTDHAEGVRIQALPYTHGLPTQHYSVTGSPLYPTGSGSVSGGITIMSDEAIVDSIQFRMYKEDGNQVLLEFYLPVQYHFANNAISNVKCDVPSPAAVTSGQYLNFTFDYTTNQSGGVWIFTRPITNGGYSPGYGASAGAPCDSGNGSGSGYFTISGDVWVDSVLFEIWNREMSAVLLDYFVPVTYHFGSHAITNIKFSPASPAYFTNGPLDTCTFNYTTNVPRSVLIDAVPFSDTAKTPHCSWSPSPFLPPGTGIDTTDFNVTSGNAVVDKIRFRMYDSTFNIVLLEFFVPVEFHYGSEILVGVKKYNSDVSSSFSLSQNYPNPFNPVTTIDYQLPKQSHVTLRVFDVLGREVATLVNGIEEPGYKSVKFNADRFSTGVYYYRLQAGDYVQTKKLLLLR